MPNIREYNSPAATQGFGVTGAAAAEIAMGARRIGAMTGTIGAMTRERGRQTEEIFNVAGNALKSAGDFIEQKDVANLPADRATLLNHLTTQWNDIASKPESMNDPNLAQRFNDDVRQPAFDEFQSHYHSTRGQLMAAETIGTLTEHFDQHQKADMAILAGNAVEHNLVTAANNNADTLVKDPTKLDLVNKQTDADMEAAKTNPLLTPEQRVHLDNLKAHNRMMNTVAAFHGMAEKNPEAAKAALDSGFGKDDLDATQRKTLDEYAQSEVRRKEFEHKAAITEQRQKDHDQVEMTSADLVARMIKPDGSLGVPGNYYASVKEIAGLPGAPYGLVDSMIKMGQTITKDTEEKIPGVNDPHVYDDFAKRMVLSPDDPKALSLEDVFAARANHQLSNEGMAFFKEAVTSLSKDPAKRDAYAQFNKFLSSQKSSITQSNVLTGKVMPEQDQRYGAFQYDMRQMFDQAYKKGTWNDVLNPNSTNYLGQHTKGYAISTKQGFDMYMKQIQSFSAKPAEPRKAGESAEEFLARGGKP